MENGIHVALNFVILVIKQGSKENAQWRSMIFQKHSSRRGMKGNECQECSIKVGVKS
jgi:hypothetical protein